MRCIFWATARRDFPQRLPLCTALLPPSFPGRPRLLPLALFNLRPGFIPPIIARDIPQG